MNLYQSFLKFPNIDYYDDDWRLFTVRFPKLVEEDKNLEKLLSKNLFLREKWIEIKDEIKYSIEDELLWLPYTENHLLDESSLLKKVLDIANNILKANLFKSLSEDKINIDGLPRRFSFLEEEYKIQYNVLPEELDDFDNSNILDDLKSIERSLQNFELDNVDLINLIASPNYTLINHSPVLQQIPIIKQVDFFDPAIYELIKKNPELLKTLDWRIFEEMLADILKTFGYDIELTRKTKDGGIDVIAIKGDTDFGMHKYILQAKRYSNSVQVSPVRELLFLHNEHRASKSCLATTSIFTKGAWELADKYRWTLDLKDKSGILNWINKVTDIRKKK